jgi:hypothetical protein
MVLIKFTLFFFLITLIWLVTLRQNLGIPYGGPFYYADLEGTSNPVQPTYKLSFKQAWNSERYVAVYFNEAGLPLLAQHYQHHVRTWQMVWIWRQNGQLMRRYTEDAQGNLTKIDVMPTPEPSPSP